MTEEQIKIDKLFDLLDEWRNFPAYQLERRADIFFALYLPQIFSYKLKIEDIEVLPEFPVRVGSIYPNIPINKSFKIDYLVVCKQSKKVLLVELKTDLSSRRTKQDDYLLKAKNLNVPGLVRGLLDIYSVTSYKKKYENYLNKIIQIGWLKKEDNKYLNTNQNYEIEIVYIQPVKSEEKGKTVISFGDIINLLQNEEDLLTRRFVKSLRNWAENPI
jgi:hypothetical protein